MGYYRYSYDYRPSEANSRSEKQKKLTITLTKLKENRKLWVPKAKNLIWSRKLPVLKTDIKPRFGRLKKETEVEGEFERLLAEIKRQS
jgi:hypothetical protein